MSETKTFHAGAVVIAPITMTAAEAVDYYQSGRRPFLSGVRGKSVTVPNGHHGVAIDTSWYGGGTEYGRESRLVAVIAAGETVSRIHAGGASFLARYEVTL